MLITMVCGFVGGSAEVRKVGENRTVVNFSVCHTEKYKNSQGEKIEKNTWLDCSWWFTNLPNPKIAEYLKKGSIVSIEGKIEASAYLDKDNKPCASLKLKVNTLDLLYSKD